MPAIRYLPRLSSQVRTLVQNGTSVNHTPTTLAPGGREFWPRWHGFVCNAGAALLKKGKIVRVCVVAVSRGDGATESEWVNIPNGHFALGWWVPGGVHLADGGELYSLVDDQGRPMTTLRFADACF